MRKALKPTTVTDAKKAAARWQWIGLAGIVGYTVAVLWFDGHKVTPYTLAWWLDVAFNALTFGMVLLGLINTQDWRGYIRGRRHERDEWQGNGYPPRGQ